MDASWRIVGATDIIFGRSRWLVASPILSLCEFFHLLNWNVSLRCSPRSRSRFNANQCPRTNECSCCSATHRVSLPCRTPSSLDYDTWWSAASCVITSLLLLLLLPYLFPLPRRAVTVRRGRRWRYNWAYVLEFQFQFAYPHPSCDSFRILFTDYCDADDDSPRPARPISVMLFPFQTIIHIYINRRL